MHHHPVLSSNLSSVAYENGILEIRFKNGSLYRYEGVPQTVYYELLHAPSKGRYLHSQIKPFYPYRRIW
ncbi:KTSC domain-containing protein [Neisseria elongata]|uniref:KTSC domain-containing protein n=1 Tax=Neisseria elongata TaxID=495 RepID=UPI000E0D005E|nr:KTSC domain-containing protein [Neisseria elongata]MBM7064294.1 KTSC domain-containing protein [Neisseria elongata]